MSRIMAFLILAASSRALHAACAVPQEFWDWPRSGSAVLSMKEIAPCIDRYLAVPESKLVIRHGTDSESALHYDELRAWLISLAISPSRIAEAPDLPKGISIETAEP